MRPWDPVTAKKSPPSSRLSPGSRISQQAASIGCLFSLMQNWLPPQMFQHANRRGLRQHSSSDSRRQGNSAATVHGLVKCTPLQKRLRTAVPHCLEPPRDFRFSNPAPRMRPRRLRRDGPRVSQVHSASETAEDSSSTLGQRIDPATRRSTDDALQSSHSLMS